MKCSRCNKPAILSNPKFCEKHFIAYFEKKVLDTIKTYKLIGRKDKIAVAASGGKDSTACLHILSRHFKHVTALAIDEGIRGYRAKTLADLKRFCKKRRIPLKAVSCKKELGRTLDSIAAKGKSACTICGAMRRKLLNVTARRLKATVIATGHNMDDEAQSIMMNMFRNNLTLSARLGPMTGLVKVPGFVRRVKPLYFCTEKESFVYCYLMGLGVGFAECPYTRDSYRNTVRDILNHWEKQHPGAKRNIIRNFLKVLPKIRDRYSTRIMPNACEVCKEPCAGRVCKACEIAE
jgi:uncharacterized protein (TIGR00269 family)